MTLLSSFRKINYKLKGCIYKLPLKLSLPKRNFYSGLVGCGSFVKYAYMPALNKIKAPLIISGLYSHSIASSQTIQKQLRYKSRVFASFDNLLDSGIKTVLITAPNHLHYKYIKEALAKNLDVFCEKPVTNNLREALNLRDILKPSPSILMVGFNQRYTDRVKKIKKIIEKGDIGEILSAQAFLNLDMKKHLIKSKWLSDRKLSGGGVIHNAGIHLINLLQYFFGEIVSVSAEYKNLELPDNFGEDTASCKFLFKSGMDANLEASFVNRVNSTCSHIVIKGKDATIFSDLLKSNIILKNSRGKIYNIACKKELIPDSIYNELNYFSECVINRSYPETDIDDSIKTLRVVKAANIASDKKKVIHISDISSY